MKTMFVYKMPNGYLRAKKGQLGSTLLFDIVPTIDQASKSSSQSFFQYVVGDNALGHCEEVSIVTVEQKHQAAMRFLKGLLDKEIEFAKEIEECSPLPEDRKDACRDYEMMESIKEVLGL
ncbi:hypothetical protein fHyEco03_gp77 [Escherichia phage vB_EcoM_fHy-Eco03]|nr:hypothetical protein fHyEco03_gp77 [Escherichia phage vB_EcoM_fHy-Eco03]